MNDQLKSLWPDDAADIDPVALADLYFVEVRKLYEEFFDTALEGQYAVPARYYGWTDAISGKSISNKEGEDDIDFNELQDIGYERVAKSEHGDGQIEGFLEAYWVVKELAADIWNCRMGAWYVAGINLGAAIQRLGFDHAERSGSEDAYVGPYGWVHTP